MIVEHIIDEFPVGMRVLAVDDDPTCLMLLETLLTKCQYYVETTNRADKALEMLRDSEKKFDLVISDVHMPDMDGFKLLELVGLEMDLPVIMLSAYGDNKLVMKGITHGACDYLLKPVRIEELKNIWQHVIRKKKNDSKDDKYFDKFHGDCGEGGEGLTGDYHQNGKLNRKRKDQNDDEDEEHNDNGHNNEDPSMQKKPRVVWSVDLHRKFVAAVHHLGIDKAVPKKILDLMNVEKLTRENVASHLQKYRLYLRRISCVASQQANMISALGSADSAYLQMASLNGLGDGSAQFQNAAYRPFSPSSVLGRQNTPLNGLTNCHQGGTILQGMPMSLHLDQLQHNQGATSIDSLVYPISSNLSDTKLNVGSSSKFLFGVPNNPLMIEGHLQDAQTRGDFPPHLPDYIQFQTTSASGNGRQNLNFTPGQDAVPQPNILSGSMDSSIAPHGVAGLFDRRWDSRNTMYQMNEDFNVTGQVDFVNPLSIQHNEVGQSALEAALKLKQGNHKEQEKTEGSYGPNRVDSLEDLVSLMMKQV